MAENDKLSGNALSACDAVGRDNGLWDDNFWNQRYATGDYVYGTAPNAFLVSQAHRFRPGMRVLAVADGEGRNGVWLAEQGLDVVSVDVSPVGQQKAKALAAARSVNLITVCADLGEWDWRNARFDAVVGIFIQFAGPALRRKIFSGMCAALNPGGLVILHGYREEQLGYATGGPSAIEHLYSESLLQNAFGELDILHLRSYDAVLDEGQRHCGPSALIDLVARKR
ncbi:SAM-dependent methyltransferase [Brenneria rubrifaciens]|uniref:Methyltransferase domain-containing protein n=1 Tax=Brenneria rubrifaciens TaxID=55213 RepID=A0A4P8QYZ7_9GAMM|nr:class I SAM-dependent methyltransferase [Brenneria rubrifaciens]QCR09535.1 methyltransferase domain-containing protein [Brenneria rubrifaciens]